MKKVVRRKVKEDNSGIFVPAGLFIGMGFGALMGEWVAGIMFGLGAGFLVMGISRVFGK